MADRLRRKEEGRAVCTQQAERAARPKLEDVKKRVSHKRSVSPHWRDVRSQKNLGRRAAAEARLA